MYSGFSAYQFQTTVYVDANMIEASERRFLCGSVYFDSILEIVERYEENGGPLEEHDSYEEGEELEDVRDFAKKINGINNKETENDMNRVKLVRMLRYGNATKAYEWAKELKEKGEYPGYLNEEDAFDKFEGFGNL